MIWVMRAVLIIYRDVLVILCKERQLRMDIGTRMLLQIGLHEWKKTSSKRREYI